MDAIAYFKVPASLIQREFVTSEEMGLTNKQFHALSKAGICIKVIPSEPPK
jgi:hypothetical protein